MTKNNFATYFALSHAITITNTRIALGHIIRGTNTNTNTITRIKLRLEEMEAHIFTQLRPQGWKWAGRGITQC